MKRILISLILLAAYSQAMESDQKGKDAVIQKVMPPFSEITINQSLNTISESLEYPRTLDHCQIIFETLTNLQDMLENTTAENKKAFARLWNLATPNTYGKAEAVNQRAYFKMYNTQPSCFLTACFTSKARKERANARYAGAAINLTRIKEFDQKVKEYAQKKAERLLP
jgi:hypothetical protein